MFKKIKTKFALLRGNALVRNAGWMLVGQGFSVALQAGYFVFLARLLGAEQYGMFAGAFALVAIFAPYASMGSGTLFMRHVGADHTRLKIFLGNILLSSACLGSFFVLLLYFAAPHVLNGVSASLVLPLAVANCIFSQLVSSISQVFQAFERLKVTALLNLLVNTLRFLAVAGMMLTADHATAFEWTIASMFFSAFSAALCIGLVLKTYGRPRFDFGSFMHYIPEGFGFSLGGSAQSVYNDVDKTLLSHYGLNIATGIYTMAYRVIDIATLPITALDAAVLPRYFREANDGDGVICLAQRLGRNAAAIGFAISAMLFSCAHLLPLVVGKSFEQSVSALRWLSLIPAIRGWHQLTGSAIAGLGFQRYRTIAQFSAAGFNLVLNLCFIPRFGWMGAAWASIASDALLCVFNAIIIRYIRSRHLPKPSIDAADALDSAILAIPE